MRGRPRGPVPEPVSWHEQLWPEDSTADQRLRLLGVSVSRIRYNQGMTRHELSVASGVSNRVLRGIEFAEGRDPQLSTVLRIADALGVASLSELIEASE